MHQHLLMSEFEYWGVPGPDLTVTSVAPMIMRHGTEQNKKEFLPPIARGEIVCAVGYSEPNAGTDLASLRTRAVRDGDEWVITGSKIWNSGAQRCTHEWLCVRTDPDAQRHRGISVIMVPIDSPGVDVRPLYAWSGYRTNETFFHDVRVPVGNLIGEVNKGWTYITGALDLERGALTNAGDLRRALDELVTLASQAASRRLGAGADPAFRRRLAQAEADVEVAKLMGYEAASMLDRRTHTHRRGQRREDLHQRIAAAHRGFGDRPAGAGRVAGTPQSCGAAGRLLRAPVPGIAADALRRRHQRGVARCDRPARLRHALLRPVIGCDCFPIRTNATWPPCAAACWDAWTAPDRRCGRRWARPAFSGWGSPKSTAARVAVYRTRRVLRRGRTCVVPHRCSQHPARDVSHRLARWAGCGRCLVARTDLRNRRAPQRRCGTRAMRPCWVRRCARSETGTAGGGCPAWRISSPTPTWPI